MPSDWRQPRNTSADRLTSIAYPRVRQCSRLFETWPVDDFPGDDPFLPWIHDVFPSRNGRSVQFVAQNRRRCETGEDFTETMKHWEPQMALFQPIPVLQEEDPNNNNNNNNNNNHKRFRLSTPEEATWKETRFLCRFHTANDHRQQEYTTLSEFPFNYEYVSWRKDKNAMFETSGKDVTQFWLSQLLFSCPIPAELRRLVQTGQHVQEDESQLWLDLIPIRTPARHGQFLFTEDHVGTDLLEAMKQQESLFDSKATWGDTHILPEVQDSGRWANIPICLPPASTKSDATATSEEHAAALKQQRPHELVACTWTAASYTRRGDAVTMGDTAARLREWIAFHVMVGFDQLYIYDNTPAPGIDDSPLRAIAEEFPGHVVYHRWPCQVCNNHRPNHANPGERSSQYAAEASCRERYGSETKWMAFVDTDEYMVPVMADTWRPILETMEQRNMKILKMRSSRTKPRVSLMDVSQDQSTCEEPASKKKRFSTDPEPCLSPRKNETFLKVYNCEFIRPPRPDRFERAMKQIYQPDHVYSHFVHYSTVTADVARLRKDFQPTETYARSVHAKSWKDNAPEVFLNELTEGMLVHTKSVLPEETMRRSIECQLNSKYGCALGYPCPDHVEFVDALHQKNVFHDDEGKFCNCWLNRKVEDVLVPKLETFLSSRKNG